jgi:enediyne biosynthesis protein E4
MRYVLAGTPSWLTPWRLLSLTLLAAAMGFGAVEGIEAWCYRVELSLADHELAAGRYEPALRRLERLSAHWPGRADVEYPRGICHRALEHVDAALAAWERVPRDSPLGARSMLDRGRLALDHGRLAIAESSIEPLLVDLGDVGQQAARLADQIDLFTGRRRAIRRRIERRWQMARDQVGLLRLHWQLDSQPTLILAVGERLKNMAREAPDDDRVWLGLADLEASAGQYDEADALLRKCEARRAGDPDVLLARLTWALDTERPDEALSAASRLAATHLAPSEAAGFAVRLALLYGTNEQKALERRVELDPGDCTAWGRLAELAARGGETERAARYRRRKAEIARAIDQYRMLMGRSADSHAPPADELARTAETLGRQFEAQGWWTIWLRQHVDDRDARAALDRLVHAQGPPLLQYLALADLIVDSHDTPSRAPASRPRVLAVPTFRDDSQAAGLGFFYDNDPSSLCRLPETMGGGLGFIDYDGDGWFDVYVVQGGMLQKDSLPLPSVQRDRLFRNKRNGTFEDVTAATGLAALPGGYGHGVAVGDYNNDGHPDLFVTRWRSYALYRNRGNGTFDDATDLAGLSGPRDWPTSAAFGDLDGDGDLDLYVGHYTDWDPERTAPCPHPSDPARHGYCVPRGLGAMPDHIFRNDGGRFVDVSARAGVRSADRDGRGLGVVIADLDGDGRSDIYVANDMTANFLFHNRGDFLFEEVGESAGVAAGGDGGYRAGMGIACGDTNGDGRPELAVTNFYGESTSLFANLGGGLFGDRTAASGLAAPTRYVLGFGASFLDADNDGRLDLAQANGHVNDNRPAVPYAMPAQLFLGDGFGRFVDVSRQAGEAWQVPHVGRGLAVGDLDNDGRLDVLVTADRENLVYLHNRGPAGHFIVLGLEGKTPGSNRDAVGARVTLTAGSHRQVAERIGGGSYLSACDNRLHFGLGAETDIDDLEVRWPSGHIDHFRGLAVDTGYRLREGQMHASPLPGWTRPGPSFHDAEARESVPSVGRRGD